MKASPLTRERAEDIIERHSNMVYRLAFSQMKNRSDADDVFQEVFLRFVRKMPLFESDEHEKAWFIRVTLNCCRRLQSSAFRRRTVPLEEDLPAEAPQEQWLAEELKRLPEKYASVLHLFYWEEMSIEEIGRALKLTPGAIKSRLSRGRAKLRERLKGEPDL